MKTYGKARVEPFADALLRHGLSLVRDSVRTLQYVPPECEEPRLDDPFDLMHQRTKEIDDIVDRQLREQTRK